MTNKIDSQNFKIRARIAKLWQFKVKKLEEDCLAIFKPDLW